MPTLHSNNPVPSNGSVATVIRGVKSISITLSGVGAVRAVVQIMAKEDGAAPGPIGNQIVVSGTTTVTTTQTFNAEAGQVYLQLVDITPACTFSATLTELGQIQDTNPGSPSAPFASLTDPVNGLYAWAALNLSTLYAGRSTAWVGGVEYRFVGPGADVWVVNYPSATNPSTVARSAVRVLLCGDSIITNGSASGWVGGVSVLSNGAITIAHDGAVGGSKAADAIASFPTNIAPYIGEADEIWIEIGTNDVAVTANAAYAARLLALVTLAKATGLAVRLFNIPPKNGTAGVISAALQLRDVIYSVGSKTKTKTYDIWSTCISATGGYISGDTTDDTHPSSAALAKAVPIAVTQLGLSSEYIQVPLPAIAGAGIGFESNPLFADTDADGLADNWSLGGAAIKTATIVAAAFGNAQRIITVDQASNTLLYGSGFWDIVAGRRYAMKFKIDLAMDGAYINIGGRWSQSSGAIVRDEYVLVSRFVGAGIVYLEMIAPPLAARFTQHILFNPIATKQNTIDAKISQFQFIDLTALGL